MNYDKDKSSYPLKGLARLGELVLAVFLVWCTFNYPMTETMNNWFFIWAVILCL